MDRMRLQLLLKRFPKTRILVIGDLILDEFIWGSVERISPEAPVPVVWVERESAMPGGAANVAVNVRSLGGQTSLLGVVGRDAGGERLTQELRVRGIPTEELLVDAWRPTTTKTRVIAHHQQVVRIDRERIQKINQPIRERFIETALRVIPQVDGVIVEDYGKGLISPEVLKSIVNLAKRCHTVITVDPKQEHFRYYRGVTALTPNKKEAALAAGMNITDEKSLMAAGRKILKDLKPKVLLITLGEDGMCLFHSNGSKPIKIPTVAQEVFDVSGAGDTVIATFTLARAAGASFLEAATLANSAAGVVVGKVGIASCSPQELLAKSSGARPRKRALARTASWTP